MNKYIIGIVVLIVIAAAGFLIWQSANSTPAPVVETPAPEPVVQQPVTHIYATSSFSVVYPDGYTEDAAYAYQGVPKKPIPGIKFVIPATMATGTNLSADSGVSIESLPRAKACTGDIYIYQNVKAQDQTIGSRVWSVASTSDAGAGNRYDEIVYALKDSSPCIAVRYMIHSTNIGNYPEGAVQEYNRDALLLDFDKIRDGITLRSEAQAPSTSTAPQIQL